MVLCSSACGGAMVNETSSESALISAMSSDGDATLMDMKAFPHLLVDEVTSRVTGPQPYPASRIDDGIGVCAGWLGFLRAAAAGPPPNGRIP